MLGVLPCLRAFDETAAEDTDGVPYRNDGPTLGVEAVMGYEIDSYVCPTARLDGRYDNDFLVALVLRDFAEQKDFSDGAREQPTKAVGVAVAYPSAPPPSNSGPPVMGGSKRPKAAPTSTTKGGPPVMTNRAYESPYPSSVSSDAVELTVSANQTADQQPQRLYPNV